jgi:hypothetical protein
MKIGFYQKYKVAMTTKATSTDSTSITALENKHVR